MKRIVVAMIVGSALMAQEQAAMPKFDVVSVVVDRAGTGGAGDRFPKNGKWGWTRIPLDLLVSYAFNVSPKQVANIPNSFERSEIAFNIRAKMPADVSDENYRLMLQSLLADRFQFKMHREMRELPVNTIEVAKGGSKLKAAVPGHCVAIQQSVAVPENQHRCGEVTLDYQVRDGVSHQLFSGRSVTIADLAKTLSSNGPVIDNTGLKGIWDIDVNFEINLQPVATDPGERTSHEFEYQRTINSAFEKQLGLSYDPGKIKKVPVPVIVVDHVEVPTAN